jgi:ornithine carbamoyltransferase
MLMTNLLSIHDLDVDSLDWLVRRAVRLAGSGGWPHSLAGQRVGIYFRKPSTRTRTAFWAAATGLGADVVTFAPPDLQVTTGESTRDTGRVLTSYLHVLVVRTNEGVAEMRELGAHGLAVVNALSKDEHPTQAIADLATLREEFGNLAGRHIVYVGEGNSTAAALALATGLTPGLRLTLVTPEGYGLPDSTLVAAARLAGGAAGVEQYHDFGKVHGPVNAVYTSRWQTMGVRKPESGWLERFAPYQVTAEMMAVLGDPDTVFLHDLPAVRGQDVTDEVLDGPASRAWRQSFHKMTGAAAVLEWVLGVGPGSGE